MPDTSTPNGPLITVSAGRGPCGEFVELIHTPQFRTWLTLRTEDARKLDVTHMFADLVLIGWTRLSEELEGDPTAAAAALNEQVEFAQAHIADGTLHEVFLVTPQGAVPADPALLGQLISRGLTSTLLDGLTYHLTQPTTGNDTVPAKENP